MEIPNWLHILAIVSLALSALCALIVILDIFSHRQHMWIMNIIWPITALYSGPIGLLAYFKIGRLSTHHQMHAAMKQGKEPPSKQKPMWQTVGVATSHCGGGCTLGDICAETFLFFVPLVLLGQPIFAAWVLDFALAFIFGIAFQYFTIKPMKKLSAKDGFFAALKADSLSLTAWQIGMYGWMAIVTFIIFGHELPKNGPVFWFMMQLAMCVGFLTSYPINWWLVRSGIKEKM
jgi:hypothetical protein